MILVDKRQGRVKIQIFTKDVELCSKNVELCSEY